MLEPCFLQMTSMTVKVESLSTQSAYGAPTYASAASSWPAYVEPGTRLIISGQGIEEAASGTLIVLSSSASIGMQDRVTLPDGRIPTILSVDTLHDEEGQHHLEVAITYR